MKRNWEIIRGILIKMEESHFNDLLALNNFDSWSKEEIIHHAILLEESGYINAKIIREMKGVSEIYFEEITMKGYELLEFLREKTIWEKIKTYLNENGIELSISAIMQAGPVVIGKFFS
ncbi:DUF2513 domain-containing protein [Legionella taurinensis]|uniref:DUF2513 domain-containing protein n=1 Tax=Legionella taurinensis TaxID=70611 RepID=A0AB38N0N5_9GAMM|nr:DUF2513 domain-containing protein [Legionella taurinensis]MDX1838840.1 DUF2513 domain-containing protein [Legionella taurinensis]PUT38573.1 hypothetical protein DB744_13845 [Legionella taurinensis]PUT39346.1 hypothetical protein DB746_13855 [Legionella taurinensis]PUT41618.1 hypothetical protein DB743_13780 [Legionella taurinensis]PUT44645.1 hypothetical protein DB745_13795 [Legionella taurinensis]